MIQLANNPTPSKGALHWIDPIHNHDSQGGLNIRGKALKMHWVATCKNKLLINNDFGQTRKPRNTYTSPHAEEPGDCMRVPVCVGTSWNQDGREEAEETRLQIASVGVAAVGRTKNNRYHYL